QSGVRRRSPAWPIGSSAGSMPCTRWPRTKDWRSVFWTTTGWGASGRRKRCSATSIRRPISDLHFERAFGHAAAALAGADLAQEVVAVDAGAVAVGEDDRDGVVAHRLDALGGHRPGRRLEADLEEGMALASGAGAPAAQVVVVVLGDVAVAPGEAQAALLRQAASFGEGGRVRCFRCCGHRRRCYH